MSLTLLERTSAVLNLLQRWSPHLHFHQQYISRDPRIVHDNVLRNLTRSGDEPQLYFAGARVVKQPARKEIGITPFRQIFRSINHIETVSGSQTLSLQRTLSLTSRLVEERKRMDLSRRETSILSIVDELTPLRATTRAEQTAADILERASTKAVMVLPRAASSQGSNERSSPAILERKNVMDREAPAVQSPPLNMEQITEHVIRQIDHRLIAYRERMGRPAV